MILTSNSVSDIRKIEPAGSFRIWIPSPFDGYTLHNHSDASKQRDNGRYSHAGPDKHNLNPISHDSKKERANCQFSYSDGHETRHLAEHFILGGGDVTCQIIHIGEESPEAIGCSYRDENRVKDMDDL